MGQVLNSVGLTAILDEVVDWHYKGFPPTDGHVTIGTVGQRGWNALEGDLLFPLAGRGSGEERLRPALDAWGVVLSQPESHLAIVGFGKRDVPYDLRLPMPFAPYRSGASRNIRGQVKVTALNDQHAFVRFHEASDLMVGDRIGCHLSHPCTTFDKWQLLPLVDDAYRVTGAIRTFF